MRPPPPQHPREPSIPHAQAHGRAAELENLEVRQRRVGVPRVPVESALDGVPRVAIEIALVWSHSSYPLAPTGHPAAQHLDNPRVDRHAPHRQAQYALRRARAQQGRERARVGGVGLVLQLKLCSAREKGEKVVLLRVRRDRHVVRPADLIGRIFKGRKLRAGAREQRGDGGVCAEAGVVLREREGAQVGGDEAAE
jgi:hypothetical protein